MAKGKSVVQIVHELAEPIAAGLGVSIWDIRYEKEGSSWFLRVFIDKENGVTIEDCENFSRTIDKRLDETDPIDQSYYLEVSSPGIDRELVKPEHFNMYIGSIVDVRTIRPIDGVRDFTGELIAYDDEGAHVALEGDIEAVFKKGETAFIRLNIDDIGDMSNIDDIDFGGIEEDE